MRLNHDQVNEMKTSVISMTQALSQSIRVKSESCTHVTLVVKGLWSIPLVVSDSGPVRTVHRQLKVVCSQSVKVSIMI